MTKIAVVHTVHLIGSSVTVRLAIGSNDGCASPVTGVSVGRRDAHATNASLSGFADG